MNLTSKARELQTKINKWNITNKKLCTAKENFKKTKKQPSEWENVFAKNASYQGLISKIYKNLI